MKTSIINISIRTVLAIAAVMAVHACDKKSDQSGKERSSLSFTVVNPLQSPRTEVSLLIPEKEIGSTLTDSAGNVVAMVDGKEVPAEVSLVPAHSGLVVFLDSIGPSASLEVELFPGRTSAKEFPKRTQAELSHKIGGEWNNREYIGGHFRNVNFLRVPPEHKDHSWYLRYEGPGWESDKVGYRFYLDQRNAIDVFGKLTREPVLQQVGHDNFDSYHEMRPWGMDIMKVGKSLGIGSLGVIKDGKVERVEKTDSVTCLIAKNGDLVSSIKTNYFGWVTPNGTTDVASLLTIHAGSRLTRHDVDMTKTMAGVCTGIVKDEKAQLFQDKGSEDSWGYLATYGRQSLNDDELGLVIFFDPSVIIGFNQDEASHVVEFVPSAKISYFFGAAWTKEPGGIENEEAFLEYVRKTAEELANPLAISKNEETP